MKKWKIINIIIPIVLTILWLILAPLPIKIPTENNTSFWFTLVLALFILPLDMAIGALLIMDWQTGIVDWRWWKSIK